MKALCGLGARCPRLLLVLPFQLWRTWIGSRSLKAAYHRTVAPVVRERIHDRSRASELNQILRSWAVQGGYLVVCYARVVGRDDVDDLATAAASFTRLYDDLLDERADDAVGERLRRVFAGESIAAEGDVEWIVGDLFRWLAARVPRSHAGVVYDELRQLHQVQLEATDLASGRSVEEIKELTIEKGGAGMAILGGLVNDRMEPADLAVLHRLGGILQLIDDFDDTFEDGSRLTSATFCGLTFGALAAELHSVSSDLRRRYGATEARPFIDGLYIWLIIVGTRRVLDHIRGFDGHIGSLPQRVPALLTHRKPHIR